MSIYGPGSSYAARRQARRDTSSQTSSARLEARQQRLESRLDTLLNPNTRQVRTLPRSMISRDPSSQAIMARLAQLQQRLDSRIDTRVHANARRVESLHRSMTSRLNPFEYVPPFDLLSGSPQEIIPKSGRISPRLPNELMQHVIQHLDNTDSKAALANLLQTSRAAYDAVAPALYNEVVITRRNAESFYRGLPPGPPRVKRAKRIMSTTWQAFERETAASRIGTEPGRVLSDCEVALEATRRDIRRQKHRDRDNEHHNVWPHVDVDSDDSDSDSDSNSEHSGDSVNNTASKQQKYLTDYTSIERKEQLLDMVTRLHFDELPPTYICENLARLKRQNMSPAMKSLISVSFRPRSVWGIVEWEDRHESRDRHPFLIYTSDLPAAEICVQFPLMDRHLEKAYMLPRIVSQQAHRCRDQGDQHDFLRNHLEQLVSGQFNRLLRLPENIAGSLCTRLTVHNLPAHIPSTYSFNSCRVFYRNCTCRDSGIVHKVQDRHCYNHYSTTSRVLPSELPRLGSTVFPRDGVSRMELVDLDPTTKNTLEAWIARKKGPEKEYLDLAVSLKSSAETTSCLCCGLKQLSTEEVSSSHSGAMRRSHANGY